MMRLAGCSTPPTSPANSKSILIPLFLNLGITIFPEGLSSISAEAIRSNYPEICQKNYSPQKALEQENAS
jgi:hypothetical protein